MHVAANLKSVPSYSDEADKDRVPEGMSPKVVEVYKSVAKIMSRYSAGKVPKAFKIIPNLKNWEEVSTSLT
jgi:essential nuclear protein 1